VRTIPIEYAAAQAQSSALIMRQAVDTHFSVRQGCSIRTSDVFLQLVSAAAEAPEGKLVSTYDEPACDRRIGIF
jgi:hypothetical protein